MNVQIQLGLLIKNPDYINYIKTPSIESLLYVFKNNFESFIRVKFDLSDEEQSILINQYRHSVIFFKNPSSYARKVLIEDKYLKLNQIPNPTNEEINLYFIISNIF